jgi:hypothetical protein
MEVCMTPNRYAVPLEQLDAEHVESADQVTAQPEPSRPDSAIWSGSPLHPFGDGMSGDADGE